MEDQKKEPTEQEKKDLKDTQDCKIEIDGVLKKYDCRILPVAIIQGSEILQMANIVKTPKEAKTEDKKEVTIPE